MKHINGLDYLRTISAFSVVWIHSCYTNSQLAAISTVNSYAVPAFIMTSIFLLGRKVEKNANASSINLISTFLKRIIVQYVFWTVVYLLLRHIKLTFAHQEYDINVNMILLGGNAVQLWFLPAILIWYSGMVFIFKYRNLILDCILIVVTFTVGRYLMINGYLQEGFFNCFALYTGYIFCAKITCQYYERIKHILSIYLSIAIILVSLINKILFPVYVVDIVFAISVFLFFVMIDIKPNKLILLLSSYSFGIYLSHFVFIQPLTMGENLLKIDNTNALLTLTNIVVTFIFSCCLCFFLQKNKLLKRLI